MITIRQSPTADTRTCDYTKVTQEQLLESSEQHIGDVRQGIAFLGKMLQEAGERHDSDKVTDIGTFHQDFATGFKKTEWWDRHRKLMRHHIQQEDGIPEDVNLIDVLDFIVDCVMAGLARSGKVRPVELDLKVLEKAYQNTVELLKKNVQVEGGSSMRRGTSSKVAKELVGAVRYEQYESLNDAAIVLGDITSFVPGNTDIWYMKPSSTRDWLMGYDWLVEKGILPARGASFVHFPVARTHVLLGSVAERSLHVIYGMMQGERWSPQGEARSLIQRKGLNHTSMSVGDIIGISGRFWMVDNTGFKEI